MDDLRLKKAMEAQWENRGIVNSFKPVRWSHTVRKRSGMIVEKGGYVLFGAPSVLFEKGRIDPSPSM